MPAPPWWDTQAGRGYVGSCLLHAVLVAILSPIVIRERAHQVDTPFLEATLQKPGGDALETALATDFQLSGGVSASDMHDAVNSPEFAESQLSPDIMLPDPRAEATSGPPSGGGSSGEPGKGRGKGRGKKLAGKNAVKRGSFTAWTEPDDPAPGENYLIVIEVQVPEKVKRFPRADLSGLVTGTDGWRQPLPGPAERNSQFLPVEDHVTQIEVEVPGAGRRVQDTIQVRSRMLKEEQVLKIVF